MRAHLARTFLGAALFAFSASADYGLPGPYAVSTSSQSVQVSGTTYPFDLYVPDAGPGAPPIVAVGHGFSLLAADMAGYGRLFGSYGNVVVVPQFPFLNPDHAQNARVMLAAIDQVLDAGLADGTRQAVAGHSAGGLSAFLAASMRPSIRAVMLLDAVDTTLGVAAAPSVVSPTLFLFGDPSSCNNSNNSEAWYAPVGAPKAQMHVVGATHCDPQDPIDSNCSNLCPGADATKTRYFERYASGWLQYFVACDAAARSAIDGADFQADVFAGALADAGFSAIALPAACAAPDAGTTSAGDAGSGADSGQPSAPDAGAGSDAGTVLDAGAGAGTDAGGAAAPGSSSCGCTSAAGVPLLAAAGVWAAVRSGRRGARLRRARRSPPPDSSR